MLANQQIPPALSQIIFQDDVREFFTKSLAENHLAHAYLFVGQQGSEQDQTALGLAQYLVCDNGGCTACDECIRVAHHTHPDIHWYEPESALGYLIDQVREIIQDVALSPQRAQHKLYILAHADMLRDTGANALLKTLEEPPEHTTFILMAPNAESVLDTIVSRCVVVPFHKLTEEQARESVRRQTSATDEEIDYALALTKTPAQAKHYLMSAERKEARREMVSTLLRIYTSDSWDLLQAAKQLVVLAKAPLDALKIKQEEELEAKEEFLDAKAKKNLLNRQKRELSRYTIYACQEILSAAELLLRDAILVHNNKEAMLVNKDIAPRVVEFAHASDDAGVLNALQAVQTAQKDLTHTTSVQLVFEVMLCTIKEALCPASFQ